MSTYTVARLKRTCIAMPSQWSGRTTTGEGIYVRYRHGWLSVDIGPCDDKPGEEYPGSEHTKLYQPLGGRFDGDMTIDELKKETADLLDFTGAMVEDDYAETNARLLREDEEYRQARANIPMPEFKGDGKAYYWNIKPKQ